MSQSMGFSFDKTQRLLNSFDFQEVFKKSDFKIHQLHLLLIVKVKPSDNVSRLGVAITKKKVKRANERNRIKRLIREYFRLHHAELENAVDIVLTVKQSTKELTNSQITQQIEQAFEQIHYKLAKKMLR